MTEQSRTPLTDEQIEKFRRVVKTEFAGVTVDNICDQAKRANELELSNAALTAELARYKEAKVPEEPHRVQVFRDVAAHADVLAYIDALLLALRKAQVDAEFNAKALRFAAGIVSTMDQYSDKHPEEVLQIITDAARGSHD